MSSLSLAAPAALGPRARAPRATHRAPRLSVRADGGGPNVRWATMQVKLKSAAIPSISVAKVAAKQAEGYALVDVRPEDDYNLFHAPGSVNVPLFGPITLDSPSKVMKQLLYSFNGMKGTDENPRFLEQLAAAVPSKSKVLLMCDSGGTYLPVGVTMEGRRSRSLVAAYKMLEQGGWADIVHVYGGIREWAEKGMEMEGDDIDSWRSNTGKMPPMPPMPEP